MSCARPGAREQSELLIWRTAVADKLDLGSTLPQLALKLAGGGALTVPTDLPTPYAILLFYRGHW